MSNEVVLRVARAIEDALARDPFLPDVARAAIRALGEPSEAMIKAAHEYGEWPDDGDHAVTAAGAWKAMIKAATA